jgi:hypothetical protein
MVLNRVLGGRGIAATSLVFPAQSALPHSVPRMHGQPRRKGQKAVKLGPLVQDLDAWQAARDANEPDADDKRWSADRFRGFADIASYVEREPAAEDTAGAAKPDPRRGPDGHLRPLLPELSSEQRTFLRASFEQAVAAPALCEEPKLRAALGNLNDQRFDCVRSRRRARGDGRWRPSAAGPARRRLRCGAGLLPCRGTCPHHGPNPCLEPRLPSRVVAIPMNSVPANRCLRRALRDVNRTDQAGGSARFSCSAHTFRASRTASSRAGAPA